MLRYEAQIPRVEMSAQHKQLTFSLHVQICRVAAKHQELLAAHVSWELQHFNWRIKPLDGDASKGISDHSGMNCVQTCLFFPYICRKVTGVCPYACSAAAVVTKPTL